MWKAADCEQFLEAHRRATKLTKFLFDEQNNTTARSLGTLSSVIFSGLERNTRVLVSEDPQEGINFSGKITSRTSVLRSRLFLSSGETVNDR